MLATRGLPPVDRRIYGRQRRGCARRQWGPVVSSTANPDYVGARGIIRSSSQDVGCPSTRTGEVICGSSVMFIGIMDVLDFWNVQIETAP